MKLVFAETNTAAMDGLCPKDRDVQTYASQPQIMYIPKPCIYNNEYIRYIRAKVRTTPMVKSNLLFCNMNTWLTRKVNQERVQVNATLREGAL